VSPYEHPLSLALRLAVAMTVIAFVVATRRALVRAAAENERSKVASATRLAALPLLVALVFSHVESMRAVLTNLAIPGVPLSMMLFVGGSFAHGPTRRAFAALDDGAMRGLLGYRAMFGAFLFAMAAVGHVPQTFAFTAGLGDLAVGWLAGLVPARLGAKGSRLATAFVHGVGALDLVQVMVLAATVVVPWSKSHDYAMTTLSLPWVAVPLMMAVNLHGLRLALGRSETRENQASEEPRSARPEPARDVRGALRGA
jgi:hypothetical protein